MRYIKGIENYTGDKPAAVTIGKLDALHRGHRHLIENVRIMSRRGEGMTGVVIIFSTSPRIALKKEEEEKRFIITDEERIRMLSDLGMDVLLEINFDDATIHMEPEDFIRMLSEKLNMRYLTVGEDFRFGYRGRGNYGLLTSLSGIYDFEFEPVKKLAYAGETISSTRIRRAISEGEIEEANAMLGYEFFLEGEVIKGNHIGRTIDFPTLNITPPEHKLLPPLGVYATNTNIEGVDYAGITNIGIRPTIKEDNKRITSETHLFNFSQDIYGKSVKVSFLKFIRPEQKFDSIESLKAQIARDKEKVLSLHLE